MKWLLYYLLNNYNFALLCSHLINDEVCDEYNIDYYKLLDQRGIIKVNTKVYSYVCLCLNCTEILHPKAKIDEHFNEKKHKLFLNLTNWKLICLECKSQYDISLADKILKYRIICNLLNEFELFPPNDNSSARNIKMQKVVGTVKCYWQK